MNSPGLSILWTKLHQRGLCYEESVRISEAFSVGHVMWSASFLVVKMEHLNTRTLLLPTYTNQLSFCAWNHRFNLPAWQHGDIFLICGSLILALVLRILLPSPPPLPHPSFSSCPLILLHCDIHHTVQWIRPHIWGEVVNTLGAIPITSLYYIVVFPGARWLFR